MLDPTTDKAAQQIVEGATPMRFDRDGFLEAVESMALDADHGMDEATRLSEALHGALRIVAQSGDSAHRTSLMKANGADGAIGISVLDVLSVASAGCEVGIAMAGIKLDVADKLGLGPDEIRTMP